MISPIPIKLKDFELDVSSRPMIQLFLPSSSGVHNGLSGTLAKCIVEVGTVVLSEVIAGERLTAVLVDALEDL